MDWKFHAINRDWIFSIAGPSGETSVPAAVCDLRFQFWVLSGSDSSSQRISFMNSLLCTSKSSIRMRFAVLLVLRHRHLCPNALKWHCSECKTSGWASSWYQSSALSGPVLRDTARLSQRHPPIARYGVFGVLTWPIGCDTPSPLESMRSGGAISPPQKGYLSDTCAIPYENKANGCDTPLCNTISKGYCAIWGVSRIGPLRLCIPAGHVSLSFGYKHSGEVVGKAMIVLAYATIASGHLPLVMPLP